MSDENTIGHVKFDPQHAGRMLMPEHSDWQCNIAEGAFIWRPLKGKEPNRFWRWSQFICFGFRWEKVKP